MNTGFALIYVAARSSGTRLPNRPQRLAERLQASEAIATVTFVDRRRPVAQLATLGRTRQAPFGSRVIARSAGAEVVEHMWPFGALEHRFVRRLVAERLGRDARGTILWVSDPKSAGVLDHVRAVPRGHLVRVFDAYDAWDLSPLVRGWWRRRAVRAGYRAAARSADVVFANTPFMVDRMRALGASNVVLLPNAAPSVRDAIDHDPAARRATSLVYIGRIHERVDASLLAAIADAFPAVRMRLIGPLEREPDGWAELMARPNVWLEDPIVGEAARDALAEAAALLLPHRVDDYTRSQDAMKAWDAIAVGTPVVGTPVPPIDRWPPGLAAVGSDRDGLVAGVRSVLEGAFAAGRETRLEYARENGWDARAAAALRAIDEVRSE